MKIYTLDQLVNLDSGGINIVQKNNDTDAQNFLKTKKKDLSFLSTAEYEEIEEYYTDTMEKYNLIYNAVISAFSTTNAPQFPENIYNINLENGQIETDKNNRLISYSPEVIAPCTASMLHYITPKNNDVYVIFHPIKSEEITVEEIISENNPSYNCAVKTELNKFAKEQDFNPEEEPELPFPMPQLSPLQTQYSPTELTEKFNTQSLFNIFQKNTLPRNIYHITITAPHKEDLKEIITELETKFPSYISFEKEERNLPTQDLRANISNNLGIQKLAKITLPQTQKTFYIEFEFKQTIMFFNHLRSYTAYKDYCDLETKYQSLKEAEQKSKTPNPNKHQKLQQLKKLRDEKKEKYLQINHNAIHQSNLYLMHKIQMLDNYARSLHHSPDFDDYKYQQSIDAIKKNYITEGDDIFDGATAFTTGPNEYMNKSFYLKMIGILPESFDELGKNAKEHVMKAWNTLTPADLKQFNQITQTAVKYQNIINEIQKF